jgi:hypothetical protein
MSSSSKVGRLEGSATAAGLLSFAEVADLPTKDGKRKQMLMRCQEIYDTAGARERQSGKGAAFSDPDCHAQTKCIELASRLMNLFSEEQGEGERREADIQQIAQLFRSMGWELKPPKAA